MSTIDDHPLRYKLANELHARPFPAMHAPGQVAFIAFKPVGGAAGRDRSLERAHLLELLDRHAAPHPEPDATHYFGQIGRYQLKWESHTEFFTYTLFYEGSSERAFDASEFDALPADWLEAAPGKRVTSISIRVDTNKDPAYIADALDKWFVTESIAVANVLDHAAVIAGDFRIDATGHTRFALFVDKEIGARRVGRVVQRLCEIETYKAMSMLGFQRAREISPELTQLAAKLALVVQELNSGDSDAEAVLTDLLSISAEMESVEANSAFRFAATTAYEAIVHERIGVLREERFQGRQTFAEFMLRRFDPAMRTVRSTETRLASLSRRAMRAGDLLRTRVDVERSAQNQSLLQSMDKRADLQLRLQETVEGLSVVAISYYAVNLAGYLIYPFVERIGLSRGEAMAALILPVVGAVWLMVRRIRRKIEK